MHFRLILFFLLLELVLTRAKCDYAEWVHEIVCSSGPSLLQAQRTIAYPSKAFTVNTNELRRPNMVSLVLARWGLWGTPTSLQTP